ncbi:MAG: STAS domain-containing protein [Deltaproteobacteria bacterium]|nr:STAS domain-containing protein [Deltaproteobacteria bacterium]
MQLVYLKGHEGSHMEINTKKEAGKGIIVSVRGRIDSASTTELEKVLAESMGRGEKVFVIDLSEVNYISSAGLRSILIINKKLKEKQGLLMLSSLQDMVKEVFDISGSSSIIPIYESTETAFSSI